MKKTLWTVNVDNYEPDITRITYPLLKRYAHKCRADFNIITERKYPEMPPTYEKLQIHELGQDSDWNIFIDSDAIVHPDFFDVTNHLQKDTVCHNANDMAGNRWTYDKYFLRDGRHIGSCNWFAVGSNWCLDLWRPLEDITLAEALENINPAVNELATHIFQCENPQCRYQIPTDSDTEGKICTACNQPTRVKYPKPVITAEHLIDDYVLSRNIAKYGLKFTTVQAIQQKGNIAGMYLWHIYTLTTEQKIEQLKKILTGWGLTKF